MEELGVGGGRERGRRGWMVKISEAERKRKSGRIRYRI